MKMQDQDSDEEKEKNAKLFSAIRKGKLEKVQMLLEAGVKVDIIDKNNKNNQPLHYAVEKESKEIVEILVQKWKADINAKNNLGNTPLHIAVSKGNKELVELLLRNNAEINIENNYGKTPLGIAKSSSYCYNEDIIQVLEKIVKHPGHARIHSTQKKEIKNKLEKFVEDFVFIFERSSSIYYDMLENEGKKPGKWADFINKLVDIGKTGAKGIEGIEIKAPTYMGLHILQEIISNIGSMYNREQLRKLTDQLYIFKTNPDKTREELVKSSVDIFQNFESQFVQVTVDGSWQIAMKKLAEDAVNRVFDYHRNHTEKCSASSVCKSIILGKSKAYKTIKFTGIPQTERGHSLTSRNSDSWNSAKIFDKAGLVTIGKDGVADKYYKKKGKKDDKYGHRLLFNWESENEDELAKKLKEEYQEEMRPREEYMYTNLKPDEREELQNELLSKINNQDPKLMEERLVNIFESKMEDEKQWIGKSFKKLENFIHNNFDELLTYVKTNQNVIKEILNEVKRGHPQCEEIAKSVRDGREENTKGFQDCSQKLDKTTENIKVHISKEIENFKQIISEFNEPKDSVQIKLPICFDLRDSVTSFIGREEQLKKLAEHLKQGTVVISGLGGVGKSELAVKYAHSCKEKDNVIWINAETHATAEDSFLRLMEELGIKSHGLESSMKVQSMAKKVYNFFTGKKSLFVLDNAQEHSIIKEFLPLISTTTGYHFLITSQNHQLFNEQEHGEIQTLTLDTLPKDKAVEFIKKVLKINNARQDQELKELVKILGYLPLALQQSVAYIKESNYVQSIGKCVQIYKKSEQEMLSFLKREGLSSYDKQIYLTFKTSIDKIKQKENGKLAEEILNTIAYFAPNNIPQMIFLKLAREKVEECDGKIENDIAKGNLARAINLLVRYSIINIEKEQISIHRLVQQVIRSELKKQEEEVLTKAIGLLGESRHAKSIISHIISIWTYGIKYDKLIDKFLFCSIYLGNEQTTALLLLAEGGIVNVSSIIEKVQKKYPDKLSKLADCHSSGTTLLHMCALNGQLHAVKYLIEERQNYVNEKINNFDFSLNQSDINTKNRNGWTPLHTAATGGHLDVVKYLVESRNADINVKTNTGYTPLHLALIFDHVVVAQYLIEKGADSNVKNNDGWTLLHSVATVGHLDVVKYLVENRNTDINEKECNGNTPLQLAVYYGHVIVAQYLIEKGADTNTNDNDGLTLLHSAVTGGHLDVVKYLVQNKSADINVTENSRNTPLHLAVLNGHVIVARYLIEKGADTNINYKHVWTPLHAAATGGHLDVVKLLVENGSADINVKENSGNTPLHLAAVHGHVIVVQYLIEKGADTNANNKNGSTPLHSAVTGGHLDVVKYLVENRNADINVKENSGDTPLQLAVYYGHVIVALYLIEKRADTNVNYKHGWAPLVATATVGHLDVVK